jgi:hypothetical protein
LKQVLHKNEEQAANADMGLDSSTSSKRIKTVGAQMPAFIDMIVYIQNKVIHKVILNRIATVHHNEHDIFKWLLEMRYYSLLQKKDHLIM